MRIVTVTNQTGGVGTTTLVCHLALAGVERGLRTLVVDLDTQGNASTMLARDATVARQAGGSAALFAEAPIAPAVTPNGLHLLHGHQRLDEVDQRVGLADATRVRDRLRGHFGDAAAFSLTRDDTRGITVARVVLPVVTPEPRPGAVEAVRA